MKIREMFRKKITEVIQGVIIAGQGEEDNVRTEVEDYVVTKEILNHFRDFFTAYKQGLLGQTTKIGVWIAGFFGCGKSHFMKMVAYILSNVLIDGKSVPEILREEGKIDDPALLADMELAARTPTDVILFNIDAKNESGGKANKDTIVNVFLKVFNDKLGFCGALPHLADLERQLSDAGRYEEFKEKFEAAYGDPWEASRQDFDFIQDTVVDVLSDMGFMSEAAARNWCEKAMGPYSISIEDFAKRVKSYIDRKGNNHHVVFLADEMGQYIGEDSRLMLNLQTVTEELGKECLGRAWVIVTSQQDIDSITHVKGNDFSKIQGRFDTRISLSSANVDFIIKERLLKKTAPAAQSLRLLYDRKATVIRDCITFTDLAEKKLYSSAEDFAEVYPFIPYQFNVLSNVLTAVRTHGASGKHLSEGARSMLALAQRAAVRRMDAETGALVPFHYFYDGLDNFLDHSHRGVILQAYENGVINPEGKESDVFAVNVLKTLFLIKYIGEVEPNVDNLTSLMVEHIDQDRLALKQQVEDALRVLTGQMLVQKNGERYEFLTDEEQEINRAIQNQPYEHADVIRKASEMIFEEIFTDGKYRYPAFAGRYTFPFNQVVDDRPYKQNQKYDITLHILTPWYDGSTDDATLRLVSGQNHEVMVVLPGDAAFLLELQDNLKIENFLRLDTVSRGSRHEELKAAKSAEMRERRERAKLYLRENLKDAAIYVNGAPAQIPPRDVSGRINEALGRLVQTVYFKLAYIDTPMGDAEIRRLFQSANQITLDTPKTAQPNVHALSDAREFIDLNSRRHMPTSMKSLEDHFLRAPYGFVEDDVHYLAAKLFRDGDVTLSVSGTAVTLLNKSGDEILAYVTKKQYADKLLLETRVKTPERQKKAVRDVARELFRLSAVSDDEDSMMRQFQRCCGDMLREIEKLEPEYKAHAYPGRAVLTSGKKLLQEAAGYDSPAAFFDAITRRQDDFLDFAEDFEPVRSFFKSEQRDIFTRALELLAIYDDSSVYIVDRELEDIVHQMRAITGADSPYSRIYKLPELREQFTAAYGKLFQSEAEPVRDAIDRDRDRVLEELAGKPYEGEVREDWLGRFRALKDGAEACHNISQLRSHADKADALKLRLLNEIAARDAHLAQKSSDTPSPAEPVSQPVKVKTTRTVSAKQMAGSASWRLETPEDVDQYLSSLRSQLLKELDETDVLDVEF